MEKRFNRDKFEEFFHDRFQDDKPASDGWNVPPDPVWENVAQGIATDDRSTKRLWYFLLLSVVAIALLILFSSNWTASTKKDVDVQSSINLPATNTSAEANSQQEAFGFTKKGKTKEVKQELVETSIAASTTTVEMAIDEIPVTNTLSNSTNFTPLVSKSVNKQLPPINTVDQTPINIIATTELNKNPNESSNDQNKEVENNIDVKPESVATTDVLAPLATLALTPLEKEDHTPLDQAYLVPAIDRSEVPSQWALDIYYRPIYAWNNIKKQAAAEALVLNASNQLNHSTGINIEKWIGKNWLIGSGIQYANYSFNTQYDLNVAYTSTDEFLGPDGHYHNTYSHSLPTVSGEIDMTHILFRQNSDMVDEGEAIPFLLELSHSMKMLSVPVYAKYAIKKGRFEYGIAGGTQLQFQLNKLQTTITQLTSLNNKIHHNQSLVDTENKDQLTDVSLSYFVRPSVSYYLFPKVAITAQPVFTGSITPIATNDLLRVYSNNVGLDVGLYFKF